MTTMLERLVRSISLLSSSKSQISMLAISQLFFSRVSCLQINLISSTFHSETLPQILQRCSLLMLSPSPQLSSAETSHQLLLTLRMLATSPTTRICGRDSPLMPATLSRTNFSRQSANATIRQSFTKFAIYLSKLAVPFMSRRTLSGKTCSIFSLSL